MEGNRTRDDSIEIPEEATEEIVTENSVPEEQEVAESEGSVNEQSSQTRKVEDTVTDDVTAGTATLDEKTDLLPTSSTSYVSSQSSSASTNNISLQQTTEKDKSE